MERLARSISEAFVANQQQEEGRPNVAEALFAVAGAIEVFAEKLSARLDRLASAIEQGPRANNVGNDQN